MVTESRISASVMSLLPSSYRVTACAGSAAARRETSSSRSRSCTRKKTRWVSVSKSRMRSPYLVRWNDSVRHSGPSRRSLVSSVSAGMQRLLHRSPDGLDRHRRVGRPLVDHPLAQFRVGLVQVVLRPGRRRVAAAALQLAEARVEHALHPVEAEEDGIILAQILADGQHPLRLGLALLQASLVEEARQLEGQLRLRRVDRQRPEVHLAEGEAAAR